ncbi:MAG TPA: hypothetical protein VMW82_00840 [Candidatus Paceibacterota bacterium]|nr:hypothetical protein [Candidatus Paceibacterota bacterium]
MILVFQIILGVGIAGFLIIAFRKIPVLLNYPRSSFEKNSLWQKIYNTWQEIKKNANESDLLHESIMPRTEKFLRKFKVFVLKLDNFLAKLVGHLRKKGQERKDKEEENNENFDLPS